MLQDLINDAKETPVAHYMIAQMNEQDTDGIVEQSEKVKRLARCVKNKGVQYKELTNQAHAIMKLMNHLRSKRDYVRVEPLLDFTLQQYHCV